MHHLEVEAVGRGRCVDEGVVTDLDIGVPFGAEGIQPGSTIPGCQVELSRTAEIRRHSEAEFQVTRAPGLAIGFDENVRAIISGND